MDAMRRMTATAEADKESFLQRRTDQFTRKKFSYQRPGEIRQIRLVAIGFRRSKAVITEMKVMPFQRLSIGMKTFHYLLLDCERAGPVVAAVQNH